MTQTKPDPFGVGGDDTYTAPDEYFVDPDLSADATKRQYPSVAAALAAGVAASASVITIRLANGKTHAWDGTNLPAADTASVILYAQSVDGALTKTTLTLETGTYDTDGTLLISGVVLDSGATVSMEVANLVLDRCRGLLEYVVDDTPLAAVPTHTFRWCDLSVGVSVAAGESNGGELSFYDSTITFGDQSQDLFTNNGGGGSSWTINFTNCTIIARESHDTFIDDTGSGTIAVYITTSYFIIRGLGSGTLVLKDEGNGITWTSSRIAVDPTVKSGDFFSFGSATTDEGYAYGLVIEHVGAFGAPLLPVDAPDGTLAAGIDIAPERTYLVFDSTAAQWRGPNRTIYFEGATGAIPGIGVPVTLDTVVEGDNLGRVAPDFSDTLFRLKGTIIIGVPGNGCVWDVDAVLAADDSPSAASILAGANPTVVYTSDPAAFTAVITAVSGSEEGFQVVVTKNSGSAVLPIAAAIQVLRENN